MSRLRLELLATAWVAAVLISMVYAADVSAPVTAADPFAQDFAFLSSLPHRLCGSPEGKKAARYISRRLRAAGVKHVLELEMPVWTLERVRCEITVDDRTVTAYPVQPNIIIPPTTPAEGIRGPLIYAGRGTPEEYGDRSPRDAIVVLEYGCGPEWRRAFALGARAVVFIGGRPELPSAALHIGGAANLVRLYVPAESAESLRLRCDHPEARIVSHVRWVRSTGTNVVALIPGTSPRLNPDRPEPEMVVYSAAFDSYGEIPHLSSAARSAANVAALLSLARRLQKEPAARDVLVAFLDGRAFYHQGARTLYTALTLKQSDFERYRRGIEEETSFRTQMMKMLEQITADPQFDGPREVRNALLQLLEKQAEFIRTDENRRLAALRLEMSETRTPTAEQRATRAALDSVVQRWDRTRRALAGRALTNIGDTEMSLLQSAARRVLQRRLEELEMERRMLSQWEALRGLCKNRWICLHLSWNLSDGGTRWVPVVGDNTDDPFRNTSASVDNPGYYGRVYRVLRETIAAEKGGAMAIGPDALRDPLIARQYVHGRYAVDGIVAGTFGIYNVALMTCNDFRPREGHPCDDAAHMDLEAFRQLASGTECVAYRLASMPDLSLPRVFSDVSYSKIPRWENNRSLGDFVGLQITGSLSEDRPAVDAVLAITAGRAPSLWAAAGTENHVPGFERFALGCVSMNGRYGILGVQEDLFTAVRVLAVQFDSLGGIEAIVNNETMGATYRINLFPSRGYVLGYPLSAAGFEGNVQVLDASSNAPYRATRCLSAAAEGFVFFHIHCDDPQRRLKLFGAGGPVMLGPEVRRSYGEGIEATVLSGHCLPADSMSARDLWELNESRLGTLREKNVSDVDLEVLHSRARGLLARSQNASTLAQRIAQQAQSLALSRQIYQPLRGVMDDLVKAIVILLLLTVPFAFAVERLTLCATSVYMRIAGFAVAFLLTFAALYFLHPGFSIAATPMIVFLAFAIILLSAMVIHIMTRKFRNELMVLQGRSNRVHNVEISRSETLMTAVHMGMSTMRRRPVRTALTTVTAVMLTFTILCFASFTSSLGVRSFYAGPAGEHSAATFMVRNVNYDPLAEDLVELLRGRGGDSAVCTALRWTSNKQAKVRVAVCREGGDETVFLDGLMGIADSEVQLWPSLARALGLGARDTLGSDGVLLPGIVQRQLRLSVGQRIVLNGLPARFAGTFDEGALQRLKHIDGQSVVPVNFQDPSYDTTTVSRRTLSTTDIVASDKIRVQRDYMRLSANQVCVVSDAMARRMGGKIFLLSLYGGGGVNPEDEGRRIAEISGTPVWVRTSRGVERMVFTRLVEVSGGLALFVPLLLGGLIIFGTLLGSIADRQREIYTFSALGLGPAHVGFLFVAEAGVYAIVGGMGGEILAQIFARVAALLAAHGIIQQPNINFSSTHSLFAIGVVMLTVLVSAVYPAIKASRCANPGIARTWKMPPPKGDTLSMTFPFTVSAYDMSGVVSFLAEHFRQHEDAGLGRFAAQDVRLGRSADGNVQLSAHITLAPFDLGITQSFVLTAVPSEIPGVDEVHVTAVRQSGTVTDWYRANRTFVAELRRQFLLWRTLSAENIEAYRLQTSVELGERPAPQPGAGTAEVVV